MFVNSFVLLLACILGSWALTYSVWHLVRRAHREKVFLTDAEKVTLENLIGLIEKTTVAEIRLYVEYGSDNGMEIELRAENRFNKLGLQNTKDKTGVLIYVLPRMHRIVVLGDSGINNKLPNGYWKTNLDGAILGIRSGQPLLALTNLLMEIGEELSKHFPFEEGDTNEVSNTITTSGAGGL